jgi:Mg2+-importing ATPase
MATQILVIFVIRTNGRPWRDLPRPLLTATSLGALAVAMVLPFTVASRWFGFQSPPHDVSLALGAIVAAYLVSAELLKTFAIRQLGSRPLPPSTG